MYYNNNSLKILTEIFLLRNGMKIKFLPESLRKIRKENGFNLPDIESELYHITDRVFKVSRQTWDKWEKGITDPKIHELVIIANCFNKKISFFFGKDDNDGKKE